MKKGITLISLVITIIIILILAGVGISGSLALIEQAKFAAFANEMKQADEAVYLVIMEGQLEGKTTEEILADIGERIPEEVLKKISDNLKLEILYARAGFPEGEFLTDYNVKQFETEESLNSLFLVNASVAGKEQAYIYDEQSASVYKVEPTIIWGVEMHGYDYGNLLVSRPGLLERAQGKGEEIAKGDYVIKNIEEMKVFRDAVNGGDTFEGRTVYLMADIDLNVGKYAVGEDGTIEFASDAEQWTPIGDYDTNTELKFSGTFKGNNHKISGLYIENDKDYQGLFGYSEGTIQDLIIEQGHIKGTATTSTDATELNHESILAIFGSTHIGGITGVNVGGEIINCTNKITVEGNAFTGGIVGYNSMLTDIESKISNCTNEGNIISIGNGSRKFVGGITGANGDTVENCTNSGKIETTGTSSTNNNYLGGITALNYNKVTNCKNYGEVIHEGSGEYVHIGGIVGSVSDTAFSSGEIKNCTNEGKITNNGTSSTSSGLVYAGGISGWVASNVAIISNCSNTSQISSSGVGKWVMAGGIVGWNEGMIGIAYNSGPITTSGNGVCVYAGGISGCGYGMIMNSYNEGIISNSGTSTSTTGAGGISGSVENGGFISNSYNRADVSCNGSGKYVDVAGIAALCYTSGKVNLCYNTGEITNLGSGYKQTGAISGYNNITIADCYYLSGTASAGIGNGTTSGTTLQTDEEMKSEEFVTLLNSKVQSGYFNWLFVEDSYPEFIRRQYRN